MKKKAVRRLEPGQRKPLGEIDKTTYQGRFGSQVRKYRLKTGLTGEEICERLRRAGCELATSTYFRWESGKASPAIEILPILADALEVNSVKKLFPDK